MTEEEQQSGNILFWGSTDSKEEPLCAPHQFSSIVALDICNGSRFTVILADDGFVYTTGEPTWYHGSEPNDDIKCWEDLRDVKKISCGVNFMAALTTLGTVYTWGHGEHGQLGLEETVLSKYTKNVVDQPTLVSSLQNIVDIQCGNEFMAAITQEGLIYTWGIGTCGCLGHGNDKDVFLPLQVMTLSDVMVKSVKCGTCHMVCVSDKKQVYSWGNNYFGTLGRLTENDFDAYPRQVEIVQIGEPISENTLKKSEEIEFVQLECLEFNTIALSSTGRVFSCGKGGCDGSGHGDDPHLLFTQVDGLSNIISLSNGSTSHVAAISTNGEVFVWGNNEFGQLGLGDKEGRSIPFKLELNEIKLMKIAMGETHTTALIDLQSLIAEAPVQQKVEEPAKLETQQSLRNMDMNNEPKSVIEPLKRIVSMQDPPKEPEKTEKTEKAEEKDEKVEKVEDKGEKFEEKGAPKVESKSVLRNTAPAKTNDPPKKVSGYMNKKGEKGLVKTYKKRWFQIEGDIIGYYDKEGGTLKGCIYVADILDVLPSSVKYGINVVSAKKRVYELHAFNEQDKQMWWTALKGLVKKK